MKTILLIIIGILVGGFTFLSYIQYTHYETWGNNEHWYYHPEGYDVECEIRLFQSPSPCKAIDEYGNTVDTKTGLGNWDGTKWLGNPDFCEDQRGIWNGTTKGCYGLHEMCEKEGGIPRFLKKSLPFPDVEENKPVEYLMDCYYAYTIEDNFADEPSFTGTSLLNDANTESEQDAKVNYVDFRDASGEIIEVGCSVGLRASPDDNFGEIFFEFIECSPFVSLVLVIVLPVAGIFSGFIIWRKRK